jgi:hypothetical protein
METKKYKIGEWAMYRYSRYESETTMTFNDEEKTATVYTCNKKYLKKLTEYAEKYPDLYVLEKEDDYSKTFTIPKRYISIRQPKKPLTEEQKNIARERFNRR